MFTGLVQCKAKVVSILPEPPGQRLTIYAPELAEKQSELGASIAINGCCLTVIAYDPDAGTLEFEAGAETLSRTNLGRLQVNSEVNLESSLGLGDPLGGHLVTGHIDGPGTLIERVDDGTWSTMWFQAHIKLLKQMASKGSITVDGVSLTLVDVENDRFSVALIPHTLQVTTLGNLCPGDVVNLETDLLAKYVERQLGFLSEASSVSHS